MEGILILDNVTIPCRLAITVDTLQFFSLIVAQWPVPFPMAACLSHRVPWPSWAWAEVVWEWAWEWECP